MKYAIVLLGMIACMWVFVAGVKIAESILKDFETESLKGVEIEEIVCFDAFSGDIFWKCKWGQAKKLNKDSFPATSNTIGFGYFTDSHTKAVIFFYCGRQKLIAKDARNSKCDYIKRSLTGDVLEYIEGLSASAESFFLS